MVMQRRNDQKVVNRTRAKTQQKWDKLVNVVKQCSPFPKPVLVKLTSEQLLQVLGFNAWDMGNNISRCNIMEKDEDLQKMIRSTYCVYAQHLKMAWDVKNWDRKSSKANQT